MRVPTTISASLVRCCFIDTLHGWIAGDSGVVLHTSDGGFNWSLQHYNSTDRISDIQFINQNSGWAVANNFLSTASIIMVTTNSGVNWSSSRFADSSTSLTSVYFLNSLTGFLAGFYGTFYKTTNGGSSWIKSITVPNGFASYPVLRIKFYDSQTGLGCGGQFDFAGVIWGTTDGGLNWYVRDTTAEPQFDVKFFNYPNAYACGGDLEFGGTVSKSLNAGSVWHDSTIGQFGTAKALAIRNISECWIPMGFADTWMYSADTMRSWNMVQGPDSSGLYDALFIDENHGWACGQYGSIYKYSSLIGIKNIQANIPAAYNLDQNYPNPFNPITTIKYQIVMNSNVKMVLYDMLGREVVTLVNAKQQAGTYQVTWDAGNKASGVYFYRIEATADAGSSTNHFIQTKKMVLLK